MRIVVFMFTLAFASVCMTGCGTYTLHGKVVEGFDTGILVVSADDARLGETGVRQVRITIHRDPGSLAQSIVATGSSGPDGTFAIELPAFGAGWMDEVWLIETSRPDYRNVNQTIRLPASSKRNRLLITVAPGRAAPGGQRDDLMEEFRRYR